MKTLLKESKAVTNAVDAVAAEMVRVGRGATVPYDRIEGLTGVARYSTHWSAFVTRLKRTLRKAHGMTIAAVTNVGFKVETANEQLYHRSIRRGRRARRQMNWDKQELEAIPASLLTEQQRRQRDAKIWLSGQARRAADRSLRQSHRDLRPTGGDVPRPARVG